MYARSYEKSTCEAEDMRTLPSGYCGVAFEDEGEVPPAHGSPCEKPKGPSERSGPLSHLLSKIPFLQRMHPGEDSLFTSLFSSTEDFLLIGIFLLLLLSKEGDPLCAAVILILFLSDKF